MRGSLSGKRLRAALSLGETKLACEFRRARPRHFLPARSAEGELHCRGSRHPAYARHAIPRPFFLALLQAVIPISGWSENRGLSCMFSGRSVAALPENPAAVDGPGCRASVAELQTHEITRSAVALERFQAMAGRMAKTAQAVPTLFYCGRWKSAGRRQGHIAIARPPEGLPGRAGGFTSAAVARSPYPARQHRPGRPVVAGADHPAGRARCLQSLCLFRAALPALAVDPSAPAQPCC